MIRPNCLKNQLQQQYLQSFCYQCTILLLIFNFESYPMDPQFEIYQYVPTFNSSGITYFYALEYPTYPILQAYNVYNYNCLKFSEFLQISKLQNEANQMRIIEKEQILDATSNFENQSSKKQGNEQISDQENSDLKPNIRNIIPNICKKLLKYLSSKQNQGIIKTVKPNMTQQQFINFYSYVESLKKQNNLYIGKKDLNRIWFKHSKSPKKQVFQKIIRILSFNFLSKESINSILLSKKMKSSLKSIHLVYRRKLLRALKSGKKFRSEK